MPDYQAVLSSHEISKNIADLLEDIDPIQYNGSNRARRVRNVNDYTPPNSSTRHGSGFASTARP